jgi:hypothetical protein
MIKKHNTKQKIWRLMKYFLTFIKFEMVVPICHTWAKGECLSSREKMATNCHSKVTFKELPKLWLCMWSCFLHHIETSNLNNSKALNLFPKNFQFSNSIFTSLVSFKEAWKHSNFHTLNKSCFLQQTSKTKKVFKPHASYSQRTSKMKKNSNYTQAKFHSKNLNKFWAPNRLWGRIFEKRNCQICANMIPKRTIEHLDICTIGHAKPWTLQVLTLLENCEIDV